MGSIKIRYLIERPSRKPGGKSRFYWSPKADLIEAGFLRRRLSDDPIEAAAEAEAFNKELDRWYAGEPTAPMVDPGSVRGVARRWQLDESFLGLGARTQSDHVYYIGKIEAWAGDKPIRALTRKAVKTWYRSLRDKSGDYFARAAIATLRRILAFAVDEGDRPDNPALKMMVRRPPKRTQTWSDTQLDAFCDKAKEMGYGSIALAARVMWALAQREGDAINMPRTVWDGERITLTQRKTGKTVSIRPLPELRHELAALADRKVVALPADAPEGKLPPPLVVCERTGERWAETEFQHTVAAIRKAAGVPDDLKLMDLRRTGGSNLGRAGCTADEIRAVTGHMTYDEVNTYVIPDTTYADNAIAKLERARGTQITPERR